ncbi:MAG: protein phosphatase 2C domain-containing protein [Anaerolineaceae bacterium]|nr:protein phosphatase 2C domain-containing protein [Anaerolineaceae bacterium]
MVDFFKKLFGSKKNEISNINVETAPLSEEQLKFVTREDPIVTPSQIIVGIGQSVGRQRDHNEDALFYFNSNFANCSKDISFGLFIVADGMGGHEYGEVASSVASKTLGDYVVQKLYSPLFNPNSTTPPNESIQEIIENGIKQAQNAVMQKAPGGGTTITAGLILGDQITIGHVGDSRLYFIFPDGRIEAKTNDHSLVRRLVDLGQISETEAKNHPNKNVLYRALGQSEPFRPDLVNLTIPKPGYILICSDGLWGTIGDEELFRLATNSENPSISCSKMVDASNRAGGPDNISVILIKIM